MDSSSEKENALPPSNNGTKRPCSEVSEDELRQLLTHARTLADDVEQARRRSNLYGASISLYMCVMFSVGVALGISIWIPMHSIDYIFIALALMPIILLVRLRVASDRIVAAEQASLSEVVNLAHELMEQVTDMVSPVTLAILRAQLARVRMSSNQQSLRSPRPKRSTVVTDSVSGRTGAINQD